MVILNEKKKKYKEITCPYCNSVLGVEEDDVREVEYGCLVFDCPICGEELDYGEKILTYETISFPQSFYHFDKGTLTEQDVKKTIKKGIENIRNNKDNFGMYYVSGNTFVAIKRYPSDEEYVIIATNDFYTSAIPFADADMWEGWDDFET